MNLKEEAMKIWKRISFKRGRVTLYLALAATLLLAAACAPAAPAPTPTPTAKPAAPAAPAATPTTKPAAATPAPTKPLASIKIPVLAPLTGPGAGMGQTVKLGVKAAEEDINKAGGINGHPIELAMADTAMQPPQAVTLVRTAAERDKAFAFVGPLAGATTDVAIPVANELKIPMLSYSLIMVGSPPHQPWAFRMGPSDDALAPIVIAAFKRKYPQVKRLVIAGDVKEKSTEAWIRGVYPKLLPKEGYEIAGTVEWESGTTDFGAIVTKLKDMRPEGIALSVGARGGPLEFAKELTRQGVKVPAMASYQFFPGSFIPQAGADMEGWIVGWSLDINRPDLKDFTARLQAMAAADPAVSKPYQPAFEYQVYDTIMMLAKVMKEAKITPDMDPVRARTLIADGYRQIKDYNGLLGKLSIGPTQDFQWTPAAMIVKGGWPQTVD